MLLYFDNILKKLCRNTIDLGVLLYFDNILKCLYQIIGNWRARIKYIYIDTDTDTDNDVVDTAAIVIDNNIITSVLLFWSLTVLQPLFTLILVPLLTIVTSFLIRSDIGSSVGISLIHTIIH